MFHDKDFDFRVVVNSSAESKVVKALTRKFRRQTRMFVFACHVLSIVISVTRTVIQSGMAGYIGLIFAMIRSKRQLDRIMGLIKEYQWVFGD
jgi:hypothetical protein